MGIKCRCQPSKVGTSVYFSRAVCQQEAGSETELTVIVLVSVKIAGQFKIRESFGLKPVSHLTVNNFGCLIPSLNSRG